MLIMRKLILISTVLMLAAMKAMAQGQSVSNGSQWNIGWGQFEAHVKPALIQMISVHEGEQTAFVLVPDGATEFIYAAAPEELGEDPQIVPRNSKVVLRNQEGLKVLIFYDEKGRIENAMYCTDDAPSHNSRWDVILECCGKYAIGQRPGTEGDPDTRERLTIDQLDLTYKGMRVDYEVETMNDLALNIITVAPGSELSGSWYAIPTVTGLNLYECEKDEYGIFYKKGRKLSLYHSDAEEGRWQFASNAMLNRRTLGHYRKSSLRLMRNEILARHGYKFSAKDLVEYFTHQPWYRPGESNENIRLSFYEQMTMALIQAEERLPDNLRHPIEEDPM